MNRQIIIVAALAMIGSFFIPWVSAMGFGASPWDIVSNRFSEGWYYALPLVGGLIALAAILRNKGVRAGCLAGGLSPLILISVLAYQMGAFSGRSSSFGNSNVLKALGDIIGMGAYVSLAAAAVLLVAFFRLKE